MNVAKARVLVTCGSSGIGKATALALAELGAKTVEANVLEGVAKAASVTEELPPIKMPSISAPVISAPLISAPS